MSLKQHQPGRVYQSSVQAGHTANVGKLRSTKGNLIGREGKGEICVGPAAPNQHQTACSAGGREQAGLVEEGLVCKGGGGLCPSAKVNIQKQRPHGAKVSVSVTRRLHKWGCV